MIQYKNLTLSGSLSVKDGITGSLQGSASYALTASFVQNAVTASYLTGSATASYALTASYVTNAITASYLTGSATASYSLTASYVTNAITASYLTGSATASYSLTASYIENAITASYLTGSATASYALTASYVTNAITASYLTGSATASYSLTASYIENAITASYLTGSATASYALTASYVEGATQALVVVSGSAPTEGIDTGSLWFDNSGSFQLYVNNPNDTGSVWLPAASGSSGTVETGSLLVTASLSGNLLTFTKGDNTTFDITLTTSAATGSGSNVYSFPNTSSLWQITHNLNEQYVIVSLFNESGSVIGPKDIRTLDKNNVEIEFTYPQAGFASIATSGQAPANTGSFAQTGSNIFKGSQTITGSLTVSGALYLSDILQANYLANANYIDDTEAAAAGIPLNGVYRTGNFLVIRLT